VFVYGVQSGSLEFGPLPGSKTEPGLRFINLSFQGYVIAGFNNGTQPTNYQSDFTEIHGFAGFKDGTRPTIAACPNIAYRLKFSHAI
jgi:hypothetical protein